jgi:sodium-dependent dicarboxylate transporter 2/3/5
VMSWWFSATAEVVMLIPIGLAIFSGLDRTLPLGIAYASLLGGMLFPLGNNQNVLAIALLEQNANIRVNFFSWMMLGLPITIVSFLLMWLVLFRNKKIEFHSAKKYIPFTVSQNRVLLVFVLLILVWFFPGVMKSLAGDVPIVRWMEARLPESVSALIAALSLFIIPSGEPKKRGEASRPLLDWKHAQNIDWNVLILVGAGLSLGAVIFKSGFAATLANGIVDFAGPGASNFFIALCVLIPTFAITSFASNTATGDLMLPIAIAVAQKTGADPVTFAMAVAWTASIGFTIPAATPSVAVALSSGKVTRRDLTRHGLAMDLSCFSAIILIVWIFHQKVVGTFW